MRAGEAGTKLNLEKDTDMAQPAKKGPSGPSAKKEENKGQNDLFFAPFMALQKDINTLFEQSLDSFANMPSIWGQGAEKFLPHVDIREDDEAFQIETRLPSERPEDVEIAITDQYLTIKSYSRQQKQEVSEGGSKVHYASKSSQRTIMLPEIANADKAEAEVKGHTLIINIPKREETTQKARKITVKKGR